MKDILRPILELLVVLPGLLLGYFPVKTYLKQSPGRLAAWLFPLMACLCIGSGLACYRLHASTVFALAGVALAAICLYTRTLTISLWKSGTIALSVCAVFACVNSLSRAVSAAIIRNLQLPPDGPWLCLGACVFYNAVCWVIVLAAYYPATHTVRAMVEDDNFAQTWYVFWVLPLAFILLNLFMIPRYQSTLQTGRVLQGYIVLSSALLVFMFCFNAVFLLMATSLNRNAKLQQENQFLSMQQQRYENLRTAIEEARQARHDMRHQFNQISALAEAGDLENLKSYLAKTVSRIPNLDMCFCENRAADSVVGYYCAMAKRDEIPFRARLDLPETLPVDEIDMCLVLSNLLENALEASLRTAPGRRKIEITACVHADRILLIEVENAFDGEINEKNGVFRSSKRRETASVSSPSPVLQKKPAAPVPLPIRTAPSPPRSCSADKRICRAYPDSARCDKPQGVRAAVPCFYERKGATQWSSSCANAQNRFGQRPSGPFCRMRRCAALWSIFTRRGVYFSWRRARPRGRWPTRRWPCWAVWTAGSSSQNTAMSRGRCPA